MSKYSDKKIEFHHSYDEHPLSMKFNENPPHAHKRNEIFYFISGHASYLVEGNIYKLFPGSVMIMRSGEFHKIIIEDDTPYERVSLHFDDDLSSCVDDSGILLTPFEERDLGVDNFYSPNDIRTNHIYECFKSMDFTIEDKKFQKLAITSNLFAILFEIKTAFDKRVKDKHIYGKPVQLLSNEILSYINANISRELSLDLLSERFFISKNHLNRVFKNATGVTVWEYIKLKRLIMAHNSILAGTSAIAACQNSGFNDYSAFYRAYKKRFGVSPKNNQK